MATAGGPLPHDQSKGLLPDIPDKPSPDDFESPVAWLFGREYIATLKWILLYTAFKGKLDARDWMNPEIIPAGHSLADVDRFWRASNETWNESEDGKPESEKEFWFDYVSDTGDGQKAMYSIAYLCLSDLAVNKSTKIDERAEFVLQPDPSQLQTEGKMLLPRGTFLFVGGDTSYHISDYGTLGNRFQNPFWWAFRDLTGKARSAMQKVPRFLFGIPGNHDYYDSIDGFNRQFRHPVTEDKIAPGQRAPQLMIPTFTRRQDASFVALRLPFDWWFWGLDMEGGEIDFRQMEFFKGIQQDYSPRKLIVATAAPTTAFGKFAKEEESQSKTVKELGLERPFLKEGEPLGEGKCRVDLAGDIHHYARYWGNPPDSGSPSNYASVMSGGGGAFFHPSHTDAGEVPQQVLYPAAEASRKEVANQIFKFRNVWNGGWVWLFGFILAFSISFAANFPQSSKDALDSFPPWIRLGISPPASTQSTQPELPYVIPRYTFGPNASEPPSKLFLWAFALIASIVLLGAALGYSAKLFKKEYDPSRLLPKKEVTRAQRFKLLALVFVAFGLLVFGILGFHSWDVPELHLTRYGRSLIVLGALIWAVLAVIESLRYSQWLFEKAYGGNVKSLDYWPIWAFLIMAILGLGGSLWYFGKHESAFLVSDLVHLIILLVAGVGLTYFAYGTGAGLKKGAGKIAFLLLGASHAFLQISVPFLLVRKGHLFWATLAALVTAVIFKYAGRALAKMKNGWPLAIAWIVFGATLVLISFVLDASRAPAIFDTGSLNMPDANWSKLVLCLFAGAIGAVMSVAIFGAYLAVSLAFNGHNNEAGGAARIEGFKQFIRFRINRYGLTGFVIGIDEPNTDGANLQPRIVDVFHVRE